MPTYIPGISASGTLAPGLSAATVRAVLELLSSAEIAASYLPLSGGTISGELFIASGGGLYLYDASAEADVPISVDDGSLLVGGVTLLDNNSTLDASKLGVGTVADARLSANVARRDQANTFASSQVFPVGSTASPSIRFGSDTNTGFYQTDANQTGVVVSGTEIFRWATGSIVYCFANTFHTYGQLTVGQTGVANNTKIVGGYSSGNYLNLNANSIELKNGISSWPTKLTTSNSGVRFGNGLGNVDLVNTNSSTLALYTPATANSSQNASAPSGTLSNLSLANLTASGGITFGPRTKSALLATSATATAGCWRITDDTPAQRIAYPDGTNWRYLSDDTVVT